MAQVPERCMQMLKQIITEIENRQNITRDQLALLLETTDTGDIAFLHERARKTADAIYGKQVFIRGLIEFTNYCKNDCIYCGIRKSNRKAERYRLTEEEILSCCANGYELGFRTFVLQGGEDPYFTDDKICALIRQIKAQYPDCAVTLSIGEKEHDSYQAFLMPVRTGICCVMRPRTGALWKTASGRNVLETSHGLSVGFKRNRLSGGMWIYGRFAGADGGYAV